MTTKGLKRILHGWFELTGYEQKAALLVLSLFVLGVLARWCHIMGVYR
jgi:hypothetical protein